MRKALLGVISISLLSAMSGQADMENPIVILGDRNSTHTWVYLCGLTDTFDSLEEQENRNILDRVGKSQGIRFLAIHPFERCEPAGNKLCWRHYTEAEALQTYAMLKDAFKNEPIFGIVGFSNGGYYLNYLSQLMSLDWPVLSIGATGEIIDANYANKITLVVGKNEVIYDSAQKFAQDGNKTSLEIDFIEHNKGHIMPEPEILGYFSNVRLKD